MFGISPTAICGLLKRRGIKRRSQHEAQKKCLLNENAFDCLTEASAYWIGFLFADGAIIQRSVGSPEIAVILSERDVEHLKSFRCFLGSTHKITSIATKGYIGSKPAVRFAVRSMKLAEALSHFGMTPNKTKRTKVVGLEDNRHFWRGVIDGDGWIGKSNGKARLQLVGSLPLLEQFSSFVRTFEPTFTGHVRPHKSVYTVDLICGPAMRIIGLLYNDCSVALERKWNFAKAIADCPTGAGRSEKPPGF